MAVHKIKDIGDYSLIFSKTLREASRSLFKDLVICVTSFFGTGAFKVLETK